MEYLERSRRGRGSSGKATSAQAADANDGSARGKAAPRVRSHPAGNVTGWSMVEFLALPANSSISVLYSGAKDAQGFLGMRKL